ncbi:MAG: FAD:protein FMN transferase [Anaerovoracaceae bacterium]|jgi:thiamine biosynthesis lipoprotein
MIKYLKNGHGARRKTGAASRQLILPAMGTINTITLYDSDNAAMLEEIKKTIRQMEQHFSIFIDDSDVSRINRYAGIAPVKVHRDTIAVISEGLRLGALTNGAFDITAGPLSRLWKQSIRRRVLPSPSEIDAARRLVAQRFLELDDEKNTVFLTRKGAYIDLGGIAKGYAADVITGMCLSSGERNAILNLGGTIRLLGRAQEIGIQDPFGETGDSIGSIDAADCALVTSGTYEQYFVKDGVRYHHIIDPGTGYPAESPIAGITLMGRDAAMLDGIATGVIAAGSMSAGMEMLASSHLEAVLITGDGSIFCTPGSKGRLHLDPSKMKGASKHA